MAPDQLGTPCNLEWYKQRLNLFKPKGGFMKNLVFVLAVSLFGFAAQAQHGGGGHGGGHNGGGHHGGNHGYNTDNVYCGSKNYRYNECSSRLRRATGVRLLRQYSNSPCIYGRSFGVYQNGNVWVNVGCEGVFKVVGR